jgi:hypothetical protein
VKHKNLTKPTRSETTDDTEGALTLPSEISEQADIPSTRIFHCEDSAPGVIIERFGASNSPIAFIHSLVFSSNRLRGEQRGEQRGEPLDC